MNSARKQSGVLTSIVIVTYNSADEISDCISSFQGAEAIEVVVVDNSSSDGTVLKLKKLKRAGLVDLLDLSPTNDGFAKAVNKAIRQSHGRDILLLNPDARVSATGIESLRGAVDDDPGLGIVAPVVRNGPGVAVMSAGEQPTLWPLFMHFSGIARAFPTVRAFRGRHLYLKPHSRVDQEVGWVSGACMYISRRALDQVGTLSERWFMYGEDIEFCHRVHNVGLRIKVLAGVTAEHSLGASVAASAPTTTEESTATSTMWAKNTFDYYRHTFSPGLVQQLLWKLTFSGGMYLRSLEKYLRAITSKQGKDDRRTQAAQFRRHAAAVWRSRDLNSE